MERIRIEEMIMKLKALIFIFSLSLMANLIAMEMPEAPKAKQSEFEKRLTEEIQKPKTKKEIQELTKKAQRGDIEAQVNLAYASFAQNNIEESLKWLKNAQAQGYEYPGFFANIYFRLNDMGNAEKFAQKAIMQNDPEGYGILGYIKIAEGDQESALELYNKAIQAGLIVAYYSRALLYIDQNKKDLAKKDLQELIDRNSILKDVAQGTIYFLNNDLKNTIRSLEKTSSIFFLFALEKLAREESWKNILQNYIQGVQMETNPQLKLIGGVVNYHAGLFALQENQKEKAIEYFKKSLQYPNNFRQEPSYPGKAAYNLYKLLLESNPREAHKYLLQAIKFKNPAAGAVETAAAKPLPKEIEPAAELPAASPLTPETLRKIQQQMIEPLAAPKTKKEIARLTKSAELGNVESQATLVRALVNVDSKVALEWAKKAEAQGYKFKPALLAELYFGLNDADRAGVYATKAAGLHDPHGYRIVGQIALIYGDLAKALEWYAKAIQAGEPEALYMRALLYIDQSKYDLAKKDLQALIDRDTRFSDDAKAMLAFLNQDFLKAIDLFKKENDQLHMAIAFEELSNQHITAQSLREQYKKQALELFKKEAEEDECGLAYYHLGVFARQEKQKEKAIDYFKKALEKGSCFWEEPSYPGKAAFYLYKLLKTDDPEESKVYLKTAAQEFKNPDALVQLGLEYYRNKSLPKPERIRLAKKYLEIAEQKGNKFARYNLAIIADYEKDYAKAKEFFSPLAKENFLDSPERLRDVLKKYLESIKNP